MNKQEWQQHHGLEDDEMKRIALMRNWTPTMGMVVAIVENPNGETLRPPA